MIRFLSALASLCILFFAVSCSSEDELDAPEATKVAFEGNPDPRFVSTWKTANGDSTYVLAKDGSYKLDSTVHVQGRDPIQSHLEGEWRYSVDRLLFKDGSGNVVPYTIKLEGDTLELSLTGSMKNKTVLKRQ